MKVLDTFTLTHNGDSETKPRTFFDFVDKICKRNKSKNSTMNSYLNSKNQSHNVVKSILLQNFDEK